MCVFYMSVCFMLSCLLDPCTVESRYLELGYLEFGETPSVYPNQKYILILSPTISWRWILFYKFKLPEVQINLHFG